MVEGTKYSFNLSLTKWQWIFQHCYRRGYKLSNMAGFIVSNLCLPHVRILEIIREGNNDTAYSFWGEIRIH